jgi:hypothetical protein
MIGLGRNNGNSIRRGWLLLADIPGSRNTGDTIADNANMRHRNFL